MKLVRLIEFGTTTPIYINPDHVVAVEPNHTRSSTFIALVSGHKYQVNGEIAWVVHQLTDQRI